MLYGMPQSKTTGELGKRIIRKWQQKDKNK
jgi:hypothetical protein